MSLKQFLFFFLTAFTLTLYSCSSVKFTKSGQPLAKYYSFSKETPIGELPLLDTNHIYIMGLDLVTTYLDGKNKLTAPFSNLRTEKSYKYMYLKFGNNGIAFYSNFTTEPFTVENIYSVGGQYCYYKIESDEIRLEFFDFNLKKFMIMYMQVLPDTIIFYKDKLRIFGGGISKHRHNFKKSDITYSKPLTWPP